MHPEHQNNTSLKPSDPFLAVGLWLSMFFGLLKHSRHSVGWKEGWEGVGQAGCVHPAISQEPDLENCALDFWEYVLIPGQVLG